MTTGAPRVGVLPLRLDDDERHVRGVGLLLVDVDDLALADEHVADLDRAVVLELLLTVEHERALGEQLAHDRVHRVLRRPSGRAAGPRRTRPRTHRERERRRRGDVLEARVARGLGVAVDRVRVLQRRSRTCSPARVRRSPSTRPVGFPITLVSTAMWRCSPACVRLGGFVMRRASVTPTSVFNVGGRNAQMGMLDGKVAIVTGAGQRRRPRRGADARRRTARRSSSTTSAGRSSGEGSDTAGGRRGRRGHQEPRRRGRRQLRQRRPTSTAPRTSSRPRSTRSAASTSS